MEKYDFAEVEKKWQDKWQVEKSFMAIDFHPTKPKYYILYEFYNIRAPRNIYFFSVKIDYHINNRRFSEIFTLWTIFSREFLAF